VEVTVIRHAAVLLTLLAGIALTTPTSAHCDTTKGPVITAARAALDAGDPNLVLHWVRPQDESAVRSAFKHTMAVRTLGGDAKTLADRYFFETLVRIHRAGEGAPYTGLTDNDPEPIIAATDRALERGNADQLEQLLVAAVKAGLAERFSAARAAKGFQQGDVAAGRRFVSAYVPLTHWVEGVLESAKGTGEQHAAAEHPAMIEHHAEPGPVTHEPGERTHGAGYRWLLPWILTGLLAITAFVEGALLLRHRRPARAS
jgi:hypothetical protein